MYQPPLLAVLLACVFSFQTRGDNSSNPLRCDVTRDTWVSNQGKESDGNNGGAPRLKTKGIQEFSILDFDVKPLIGHVIQSAVLHLHAASKDFQRRVSVSTIASDWTEGTSVGYAPEKGAACFNWAKLDQQPWAFPGSDIVAVINSAGHTRWRFTDAAPPDKDGWQTVAVDPSIVAARVAGISHGFVLFDDVGSEYERDGDHFKFNHMLNRFISSRQEGKNRALISRSSWGPKIAMRRIRWPASPPIPATSRPVRRSCGGQHRPIMARPA